MRNDKMLSALLEKFAGKLKLKKNNERKTRQNF